MAHKYQITIIVNYTPPIYPLGSPEATVKILSAIRELQINPSNSKREVCMMKIDRIFRKTGSHNIGAIVV